MDCISAILSEIREGSHIPSSALAASAVSSDAVKSIVLFIMFLKFYSFRRESMMMVTGPSLSSETFISAPKIPLPTLIPETASSSLQKAS